MEWFHIFVVSSPGLVYWQLGQSVVDAAKEYKGSGRRFSVARWEQEVDMNETGDVYKNLAKEARSMNTSISTLGYPSVSKYTALLSRNFLQNYQDML